MCGIAGIQGSDDEPLVRDMMARLIHRGPDAAGVYRGAAGTLGHRRLSIMDPAGGDQPIRTPDGRRAIVANGEIYNHPRLRERLAPERRFRTGSDSESALALYDAAGSAAAARLDGMFALAIADGEALFLARDPVGVKPLYVGRRGEALVFASEIKALDGVADTVEAFPPGHWFHSAAGLQRYYRLPEPAPAGAAVSDPAALRAALERAVAKRLMSDVPVGAFLSGGLDSSLVAALARPHVDALHTFSVGLAGSPDLAAARTVARHLDTIHHEYVFTPGEVAEHLPEVVYHLESFDHDSVPSSIATWFVARLAARHVKVVLTGEGADELFAGYRYCKDITGPDGLARELTRAVGAMHAINLQRVDRLTMAHGLEARVPFLDRDLIALAQRIPAALKLRREPGGRPVEKCILRRAAEGLLPDEVVWRDKEQFDRGSGIPEAMAAVRGRWFTPAAARAYAARHPEAGLRSVDECVYHKLLSESFTDPALIAGTMARWTAGRVGGAPSAP